MSRTLAFALVLASPAALAAPKAADVRPPVAADLATYTKSITGHGDLTATIDTSLGTIHCTLFEAETPITVASFVGLATGQKAWTDPKTHKPIAGRHFYDGLTFHRVIPQFMIQGGDPAGDGTGGPGYEFANEVSPNLKFQIGSLAMANAGPNTDGSQFFITESAPAYLQGGYTIFGQCGEPDVVKAIARVPKGASEETPATPVIIKKVTITREAAKAAPPAAKAAAVPNTPAGAGATDLK